MSALGEILTASGVPHTDHDVPGYGTPDNPTSSGTTDLFFGPELVMIHHWGATDDVGFDSLLNQAINGTSTLPPPVYKCSSIEPPLRSTWFRQGGPTMPARATPIN